MTTKFEVKSVSLEKGLGVFATGLIMEKEVIFEENPLVAAQFSWNKEYKYFACDYCLKPLESTQENICRLTQDTALVLPYPELCPTDKTKLTACGECGEKYCCEQCKQAAWNQYHRMLCQYQEPTSLLKTAWMNIHYPPETTSIELLLKIIATVEQSPNQEVAFQNLMKFSHGTKNENIEASLHILGEKAMNNLDQIQPLLAEALPTSVISPLVTAEGLKEFFSLIGRNGQGIGTSVFSEWVKHASALSLPEAEKQCLDKFIDSVYESMDRVVGTFLNCEGSGLYNLQRCVNHSCEPNANVTFPHSNSTLQLVALRHIEPGEEICISYLDECNLSRSKHSRNKILRDYYLFNCKCTKCEETVDAIDETSDEDDEMDENSSCSD